MNTSQSEPTTQQPLLAIGSFGLHLHKAPSGRFTFVGTVHQAIAQFAGTEAQGYEAFKQWFQSLTLEDKREYASKLRLDVFQNFANSGTFTTPESPAVSPATPEPIALHPSGLSPDQVAALEAAQTHFGHWWKGKLKDCWMYDRYPSQLKDHQATLQHIRNTIGGHGLNKIKL